MRGVRSVLTRIQKASVAQAAEINARGISWRVLGTVEGGMIRSQSSVGAVHGGMVTRGLSGVAARTSRKKKKNLESKEGEGPKPKGYNFVAEAQKMLGVVHEALLPFQAPANAGFEMNAKYKDGEKKLLEEVELICGKEGGAFQFRIDSKNEVMNAATPVSGALQYYFDGTKWLNVHDQHDMRGIIVRDMLRLTSSAPKL